MLLIRIEHLLKIAPLNTSPLQDLSFAAASIFVTSSVARSYQGSAGSLVVTVQNLSAAIIISISETIGDKVEDEDPFKRLHAIWW